MRRCAGGRCARACPRAPDCACRAAGPCSCSLPASPRHAMRARRSRSRRRREWRGRACVRHAAASLPPCAPRTLPDCACGCQCAAASMQNAPACPQRAVHSLLERMPLSLPCMAAAPSVACTTCTCWKLRSTQRCGQPCMPSTRAPFCHGTPRSAEIRRPLLTAEAQGQKVRPQPTLATGALQALSGRELRPDVWAHSATGGLVLAPC